MSKKQYLSRPGLFVLAASALLLTAFGAGWLLGRRLGALERQEREAALQRLYDEASKKLTPPDMPTNAWRDAHD